ncbi:DUF6777 domain-containing protein [Streptomyces sp. NPDC048484]|uniref:DUF6777 domain-containing protein n=1 Tax=Streptomyces sp. NPDC048484 TaxID=3155146 RepID=UPI00343F149D
MVRRLAVLLAAALILSGCNPQQRLVAVRAVAAGIPSLAPFFEEDGSLGRDRKDVKPEQPQSGLQQGNTPGLYGGTQDQKVCDVERLKDFLTDPKNRQKAREWARIVGITPDRIDGYIDDLTPVLLRHDTLVKNHDYKKGKAVPYNSLLEAGIAVLVNAQGLPAVKCSCGNPLKAFDKDPDPEKISVKFENGNKKWSGYEKSDVVTVKPSPQPLERIALRDVDDPGVGINRPVGSTGDDDATFDTTEEQNVPPVVGKTFAEASTELSEHGLAVAYPEELPSPDAQVTGSDPEQGTPLQFGASVALSMAGDDGEETGSPTEDPTTGEPSSGTSTAETPSSSGPSDTPTTGQPTTKVPTPDDPPAQTVPSTPPTVGPTSVGPTSAAPTSAAPTPVEPTSSGPVSSEPVSSGPAPPGESGTGGSSTGGSGTGGAATSPA